MIQLKNLDSENEIILNFTRLGPSETINLDPKDASSWALSEETLEAIMNDKVEVIIVGSEPLSKINQVDTIRQELVSTTDAKDSDGALISKPKFTKTGWVFKLESFDISMSTLGGVHYKDSAGSDKNFVTPKFFDEAGTELTDQASIDANCVLSQFDWELPFDFDIIAGRCGSQPQPSEDLRSWVVVAPDIPKAQGGSIEFATAINFKHAESGWYYQDGRTPKSLHYIENAGLTKFRMLFRHPAGFKHTISCIFEIFVSPENS